MYIGDCLCLTFEATNILHQKTFGDNLALEIDIRKYFETINWFFFDRVLKGFGFNSQFCNWIQTILHPTKLSIFVNNKDVGFFKGQRGMK